MEKKTKQEEKKQGVKERNSNYVGYSTPNILG
jgi:hypothetical protein